MAGGSQPGPRTSRWVSPSLLLLHRPPPWWRSVWWPSSAHTRCFIQLPGVSRVESSAKVQAMWLRSVFRWCKWWRANLPEAPHHGTDSGKGFQVSNEGVQLHISCLVWFGPITWKLDRSAFCWPRDGTIYYISPDEVSVHVSAQLTERVDVFWGFISPSQGDYPSFPHLTSHSASFLLQLLRPPLFEVPSFFSAQVRLISNLLPRLLFVMSLPVHIASCHRPCSSWFAPLMNLHRGFKTEKQSNWKCIRFWKGSIYLVSFTSGCVCLFAKQSGKRGSWVKTRRCCFPHRANRAVNLI